MFKIIATYGSKDKIVSDRRFVLKTVPEAEGQKKEFLEQLPVFKSEIMMYSKILPAMEEIIAKHAEKRWWPKLVIFVNVCQRSITGESSLFSALSTTKRNPLF